MIFIDSNIPMYLVGAPHPNKERISEILTRLVQDDERFITDVEVYQEILHRYTSVRRFDAIDAAFDSLNEIVDYVFTYDMREVRAAREIIGSVNGISARDALHIAVMRMVGTNLILSFDRGFDSCPGIERIE